MRYHFSLDDDETFSLSFGSQKLGSAVFYMNLFEFILEVVQLSESIGLYFFDQFRKRFSLLFFFQHLSSLTFFSLLFLELK